MQVHCISSKKLIILKDNFKHYACYKLMRTAPLIDKECSAKRFFPFSFLGYINTAIFIKIIRGMILDFGCINTFLHGAFSG